MLKTTEPVIIMTQEELNTLVEEVARKAVDEVMKRFPLGQPALRPHHVNQKQAAEMLGISHVTVGKLVRAGTLKLNACGLIPIEQIDLARSARSQL